MNECLSVNWSQVVCGDLSTQKMSLLRLVRTCLCRSCRTTHCYNTKNNEQPPCVQTHDCSTDCVTDPAGSSDIVGIPLSATWPRLCFAFAGCLQSAFCHSGSDTLSRDEGVSSEAESSTAVEPDPRAVLILQLLLAGLQGPVPSLTHLLMGFDVTRGPEGELLEVTSDGTTWG